jgi:hypothetical protein
MNDFFTRLEIELGTLTRDGMHLGDPTARGRRRMMTLLRRSVVIVTLAIALAATLDSEFPATARGSAPALVSVAQGA